MCGGMGVGVFVCCNIYSVNVGQPLHASNYQFIDNQGCKEISCLSSQIHREVGVGGWVSECVGMGVCCSISSEHRPASPCQIASN